MTRWIFHGIALESVAQLVYILEDAKHVWHLYALNRAYTNMHCFRKCNEV